MELQGQTILLTGAHRGIGRALAERLAQEPVRLLAGLRSLDDWEPITDARAQDVRPVLMDLSSRASVERSLAELGQERSRIQVLINNAGEFTSGQLEHQDLDLVYAMMQSNVLAPIQLTRALLPELLSHPEAKIVNQGSLVGYMFFPGISTYAASKAAMIGFTECLARELKDTSVSVLELITGGIDTDMLDVARGELSQHMDTSSFVQYSPQEWADKVVAAIIDDEDVLGPGGKGALGKLLTRGPRWMLDTVAARSFERT